MNVARALTRCGFWLWVIFGSWCSLATTVVVKLETNKILIAADTRRSVLRLSPAATANQMFSDDRCKIVDLGKAGFAAMGNVNYEQVHADDAMASWDALADAKTSFAMQPKDLFEVASDWQERASAHFNLFSRFAPARVQDMASGSTNGVLVEGIFAGWDSKGAPIAIAEIITFEKTTLSIDGARQVWQFRESPYSLHPITQELIDGHTKRAQAAAKKWKKRLRKLPQSEQDWRQLEFIIQSTADYDEHVGKDVDVLEITSSGSSWLQKSACPVP